MKVLPLGNHEFLVEDEAGRQHRVLFVASGPARWAFCDGEVWVTETEAPSRMRRRAAAHESLAAPMPATVLKIPVAQGDAVTKGQTVLVLEAMKMELPLRAAHDGTIAAIRCREGELVQPGTTLVEIE